MIAPLRDILLKLCRREDLTRDEARGAFLHIMSGDAGDAQIGGLLVGLAAKGTTVEELVGAATVMREKVVPVGCAPDGGVVIDTCGTGGDVLGPLTNPGRARHQLLGVFAPELTDRLAAVLRELGSERAWVVHADDGLDELSTLGPTRVSELNRGHIETWTLDPKTLGLPYGRL